MALGISFQIVRGPGTVVSGTTALALVAASAGDGSVDLFSTLSDGSTLLVDVSTPNDSVVVSPAISLTVESTAVVATNQTGDLANLSSFTYSFQLQQNAAVPEAGAIAVWSLFAFGGALFGRRVNAGHGGTASNFV